MISWFRWLSGAGRARSNKLSTNEAGTSLLEFGLAAPVLLVFVAGVADVGRFASEHYRLQQAVDRTLAMAQIGNDADYAFLKAEAAAAAGVPDTQVVQEQWVECNTNRKAWNDDCAGAETARWVRIIIKSSYTPLFGRFAFMTRGADGKVAISAHGSLRVR